MLSQKNKKVTKYFKITLNLQHNLLYQTQLDSVTHEQLHKQTETSILNKSPLIYSTALYIKIIPLPGSDTGMKRHRASYTLRTIAI